MIIKAYDMFTKFKSNNRSDRDDKALTRHMIDLKKLRKAQRHISRGVVIADLLNLQIRTITGIDLAYLGELAIVGIATFDYGNKKIIDEIVEVEKVGFPYIPEFFGFREGSVIIKIMSRLAPNSDIYMINAHGIAHPEKCGCASHVGVLMKKPTIGIANNILCGSYGRSPSNVGEYVPLTHANETVGAILKSKEGCRPIVVSPGHLITLVKSIEIVKKLLGGHKFPEPLYVAHKIAKQKRGRLDQF